MPLETWLMGAVAALAGFTAWLLRDYIEFMKAQVEAWRQTAHRGTHTAEKAATIATREAE